MIQSPDIAAPRARPRSRAGTAMVVVGVLLLVAVGVLLLFPSLLVPSSRLLSWQVSPGFTAAAFDSATAQTTTVVPIEVTRPACAPADDSWLAPPVVAYTPWSVTITMHTSDAFGDTAKCTPKGAPNGYQVGNYLTGLYYSVQLSQPLGGRALFDGSTFPPGSRSYR